jgi:alpha-beta hydrolase superfamily lysophospholipase
MSSIKARALVGAALALMAFAPLHASDPSQEVTFRSAGGVVVYGDLYSAGEGKDAPIVLLFHQAGANARAEYSTIVPRLYEKGYNVFAIDQRSGGERLGGRNRTVDKLRKKDYDYCSAYPDLVGALRYVIKSGFTGPRFVWGSSYSAALVIRLAVEHAEDIDGVLAFSPAAGPAMGDCDPTDLIAQLTVPTLALRPASEMENESSRRQFEAFEENGQQTYVAANGVHGSSMLNPRRVEGGVEETWKVVLDFISARVDSVEAARETADE